MTRFQCPRCGDGLEFERLGRLRRWVCAHAHGEAVTVSALRQLVERPVFVAFWSSFRASDDKGLACPSCARPAVSVTHPTAQGPLEVDVCAACQLVWFDASERQQLDPSRPELPERQERHAGLSAEAKSAILELELESVKRRTEADWARESVDQAHFGGWRGQLGLWVEEGAPPVRLLPLVSWSLLTVVLVGGLWGATGGDAVTEMWGYDAGAPLAGGGVRLLTSLALDVNPNHVFLAASLLFTMGDNVEDLMGSVGFGAMVVFAHLAGLAVHTVLLGIPGEPVVGSSAAVMAVAAVYVLRFPRVRLWTPGRYGREWSSWPAWGVALLYGVLLSLLHTGEGMATASWITPLVGVVVGVAVSVLVRAGPPDDVELL